MPLIDTKSADYVQGLINDALDKGAKLVIGNKREGNLIHPTLLDNVTTEQENMAILALKATYFHTSTQLRAKAPVVMNLPSQFMSAKAVPINHRKNTAPAPRAIEKCLFQRILLLFAKNHLLESSQTKVQLYALIVAFNAEVFGVLKQNYGFKRFLRRGTTNVFTEVTIFAIAYNINKLHGKKNRMFSGVIMHTLKSA